MATQNFNPQSQVAPQRSFGQNPGMKIPNHIPPGFIDQVKNDGRFVKMYNEQFSNLVILDDENLRITLNILVSDAVKMSDIPFSDFSQAFNITASEYAAYWLGNMQPDTFIKLVNSESGHIPQVNTVMRALSIVVAVKPSCFANATEYMKKINARPESYPEIVEWAGEQMTKILDIKNNAEITALVALWDAEVASRKPKQSRGKVSTPSAFNKAK